MTYSGEVLTDSALIYLRLGDASGTTATDTSGNSHPGTYNGSPTLGVTGALSNDADTAVTYNGTSQYVSIAGAAWMNVTDYSIEFWFKATTASASTLVIVNRDDSSTKLWDAIMVSGKLRFQTFTGAGSAETTDTTNTYNDGNWHHCVMTKSGTAKKIYVDGVQDGSGTGTTFGTSSTLVMNLARRSNNTLFWPGTLDEFAFYGTALTSARVSAHYVAGVGANVAVPAAAATADATAPGIPSGVVLAVPAGAATAAATAPSVTAGAVLAVPPGAATAAASAPAVSVGIGLSPPAGAATADATAPAIAAGVVVGIPASAATADATAPSITVGGSADIAVPAAAATADATAPGVAAAVNVAPPSSAATADATPPSVSATSTLAIPAAAATADATPPSILAGAVVIIPASAATADATPPTLTATGVTVILPTLAFARFSMLAPPPVTFPIEQGGDLMEWGFTMLEGDVLIGDPA